MPPEVSTGNGAKGVQRMPSRFFHVANLNIRPGRNGKYPERPEAKDADTPDRCIRFSTTALTKY